MAIHMPVLRQMLARLPNQITVNHGPREQLARFFLLADKAARDRGVSLSLSTDFELLEEINKSNRPSWHRLVPCFEHHVGGINAKNGFWLIGRDAQGEIVSTQAARFFDLGSETLADHLTSLRLFYPDPDRQKRDGEECHVTAPSARSITGRVVFSGAGWVHPDYRRRHMMLILPRISRALALTLWDTQTTFSIVANHLVEKGVASAYGYRRIEPGILWFKAPVGDRCEASLVWMPRQELLADMQAFPAQLTEAEERRSSSKPPAYASQMAAS